MKQIPDLHPEVFIIVFSRLTKMAQYHNSILSCLFVLILRMDILNEPFFNQLQIAEIIIECDRSRAE